MEGTLSIYIEDNAKNDNSTCPQIHELDIYSSVPPEKLNETPPETIEVAHCINGGYEIHSPLPKEPGGINRSQLLFVIDSKDDGYPRASRFMHFGHVPGAKAEFEADVQKGGSPICHKLLEFSANGNEITETCTTGAHRPHTHHYHRVHDLRPAA
ncbi:MAG: hypothetical protein WAO98_03710 [Alphaproteobacteria bacterium]